MAYFENINLEKGMYHIPGKSFTEVLEDIDCSENYNGTELHGLDAFERQLKRFDIKVGGKASDSVEKFFSSAGASALFPEYVARAVASGMESTDKVSDIVATVTKIDSLDYRPITTDGTEDSSLEVTAEGDELPKVEIKSAKNLVSLKKHGRMLETSYEALRFQRLDLFTVTLKQIGAFIAASQIKDAAEVLAKGDGNVAGISFADAMRAIMQLEEFKDSTAGQSFHGTGALMTPLGAKLIHVPSMESGKIIGLDKNAALEMVQAGDIITETDKLIDRQLDRAAISVISGFSRIYDGAAAGLAFDAE